MKDFITATIRNTKTHEEIMCLVRNNEDLKKITAGYFSGFPKNQIKPALQKYIATDKPLDEAERLEAFCLSACFLKQSKLFQDSSNITIGWTFHKDLEAVAIWQKEYHQSHISAGAEHCFSLSRETAE